MYKFSWDVSLVYHTAIMVPHISEMLESYNIYTPYDCDTISDVNA